MGTAVTTPQDRRLAAIATAAAEALRSTDYHRIRTQDVAARVRVQDAADRRSAGGGRSTVWLYNEVRSRRVLVALGARHAWNEYAARSGGPSTPPQVSTVTEAIEVVARCVEQIVAFHRVERFLVTQVAYGIGDIATSEKNERSREQPPPVWPDSDWGRLAEAAFEGRCAVYAEQLTPALLAASRSLVPLTEKTAVVQASALSDLVFRGLSADPDGPVERIASAFAAYWFERELVPLAGRWARDLHAAELAVEGAGRRETDRRAVQAARDNLVRILMEADTLHERAIWEGAARSAILIQDLGWPRHRETGPANVELADLRALSDATSRHGLALLRFGDIDRATAEFRLSRSVAETGIAPHDALEGRSFAARAEHNLAECAIAVGDAPAAAAACDVAFQTRAELLEAADGRRPGSETRHRPAAWRRYSLTADLRARLTALAGRPVLATTLLEELQNPAIQEFGESGDDAVSVRLRGSLGEILAQAGHPLEARHHIEAVHRVYNSGSTGITLSLREQLNRLRLIRLHLDLGEREAADGLLQDEETLAWCAAHISFRAVAEARRLRAVTDSLAGRHDEAAAAVATAAAELRRAGGSPSDVQLTTLEQTRGLVLLRADRPGEALAVWEKVHKTQGAAPAGRFGPDAALTLLWLARAADATGDDAAAGAHYAELATEGAARLEPTHPILLEAGLDQAARLMRAGDFGPAGALVEPVLDRRRLAHGRPALETGHRVLAQARALAETLGLRIVSDSPGWEGD